ncbi:protein Mis18-beta isoform X1 [Pantherophis guttatus]|uniref:Protein Mis18-beta isoform X1 n=1 Tax=Pantherophis guttatus TaxID=94885 RepID=A0A6P9BQV8_PANGU|nr:protein Mis18-beta isoform X1 [Pantherophis guttatus]
MSIRKKLRLLFEEPQVGGTITVERAEPGTRPGCQAQQSSTKRESRGERVPGARGLRLEDCVVYQCRRCRVVLGDSLHLCAQEEKLRLFVCFSELIGCFATQNEHTKVELPGEVTKDVIVEDDLMVCVEGDLIGCTYNTLRCQSCQLDIGFILYSSKSLAYLRGLFCLFKDNITCYLLQTTATVEASKVTCPVVSLKEHVEKLKESLVQVHTRVELLIKKLEEFNQQRITYEKESCKGKPYGYTNRKLNS